MRAHYLQHVAFEGLGSIEASLNKRGYQLTSTRLFEHESLPELDDIDLLIIMGGPMSVHDEHEFPWLADEKTFIRSAIAQNIPMLGVCLGAQLIADCMGANIYQGDAKEIGWFPIQGVTNDVQQGFVFPASMEVFHWHGETFDLPEHAIHLAQSKVCKHQAFQLDKSVIGLQFHLETTPESAQAIVQHCGDELVDAPYIQHAEKILAANPEQYQCIHHLMDDILDYITRD